MRNAPRLSSTSPRARCDAAVAVHAAPLLGSAMRALSSARVALAISPLARYTRPSAVQASANVGSRATARESAVILRSSDATDAFGSFVNANASQA